MRRQASRLFQSDACPSLFFFVFLLEVKCMTLREMGKMFLRSQVSLYVRKTDLCNKMRIRILEKKLKFSSFADEIRYNKLQS